MRLELDPGVPGLGAATLRRALEAAGIRLDARPEAAVGAWARTAAREAVENQPVPARSKPARSGAARQALSPRSTRGATRA